MIENVKILSVTFVGSILCTPHIQTHVIGVWYNNTTQSKTYTTFF